MPPSMAIRVMMGTSIVIMTALSRRSMLYPVQEVLAGRRNRPMRLADSRQQQSQLIILWRHWHVGAPLCDAESHFNWTSGTFIGLLPVCRLVLANVNRMQFVIESPNDWLKQRIPTSLPAPSARVRTTGLGSHRRFRGPHATQISEFSSVYT